MADFQEDVGEPAFTYDVPPSESLSEGVVTAVAAASGAEPAPRSSPAGRALDPLYDVLDPDALDAVFRADAMPTSGRVSFSYHGHRVTVHSDGRITVGLPGAADEASD